MDIRYKQTLLLDFYGELLTEKQKELCRMHLLEDWSLGEISETLGISRQGVSDGLHRALRLLEGTEAKLHMLERFLAVSEQTRQLEQLMEAGASYEECRMQLEKLKAAIQIRS